MARPVHSLPSCAKPEVSVGEGGIVAAELSGREQLPGPLCQKSRHASNLIT